MLNFFYDSLDTLKKVKKPTRQEIVNLTGIIFAVVIISAIIFALMDGIFGGIYQEFYTMMVGA
ncbi:MAG: preprotein translocase subunit SecE [Candidatus Peribacteria bacterium]|nr:MAG: preprotein translocase subunit SecE [Candidatus Peribacteria bacterium]